ncbi:MAG: hypothetical protein JWO88_3661 [Frankiales bacterium]|nr:hypothetical protein [Frankiales bacterium]
MRSRLFDKVAYGVSPWEWKGVAFAVYVVALVVVAAAVVLIPLLAWQSWARLIGGIGGMLLVLFYYRPALLRSVRRRRVANRERTDVDLHP